MSKLRLQCSRWMMVGPIFLTLLATDGCKRDPNVRKQKYLQSGKKYEADGKYKEAAIQFANALKVDRNFSDAHYEMGKTYLKMGTMMAGYQELLKTVDLAPNNVQARIDLGELQLAGGAPQLAAAQAKAVLELQPNNADAFALQAGIAAKKGDMVEARAGIQHALQIDPNRAAFHTTLAMIQSVDPQGAAAGSSNPEQELQKAIALDPKDVRSRLAYAALLERKGDKQGAEEQDQAAVKAAPDSLDVRTALAAVYHRAGDDAKAEETMRQATEDLSDTEQGANLLRGYDFAIGHPERAETAYADMLTRHSKNVALKIAYATILAERQEYDKLKPVVQDLSKANGSNPQVQLLNSTLLLHDGKVNDAFDLLQKAVKNAPDNARLQVALGKVAMAKGDRTVAESSFREAARLDPRALDPEIGLAQLADVQGNASVLGEVAAKTLAAHPDYPDAYLWRATAEINEKQLDKADADLQTVLKKNPDNLRAMLMMGELRMRQQRGADAASLYEQVLAKDPNAFAALNLLVGYDMSQKQPARAMARVQQQIAKSPQNPGFYDLQAGLQLTAKDFAGARASAKKAMELNANDSRAIGMYAQAAAALGDKDDAAKTWEGWIAKHPNDAGALSMLAMADEARGNQSKAMDEYKKVLQIEPGQTLASNNLAYLMLENGQNVDVALTLAQAARRGAPDSPSTADTLAWVYYYKGTYSTAQGLLEDALKKDPENASMHYHLGMTEIKLGDKAGAQMHLKKAETLAPNTQTAKDAATALSQLG